MRLVGVGLVMVAFSLAGCERGPSSGTEETSGEREAPVEPPSVPSAAAGPSTPEADGDGRSHRKAYIRAAAALACTELKLSGGTRVDLEALEARILEREGFDDEGFEAAEARYEDADGVYAEVEKRLDDCSRPRALDIARDYGFEVEGATDGGATD